MRQQTRQPTWVLATTAAVAVLLTTGVTMAKSRGIESLEGVAMEVGLGDAMTLPDSDLKLLFTAVVMDSRCPIDVSCMRAGEVIIRAELRGPGTPPEVAELALGPDYPGENEAVLSGHRITLLEVMPQPEGITPIKPSRYAATFMVEPPRRRVRAADDADGLPQRTCLESGLTFLQLSDDRLQVSFDVSYHCSGRVTLAAWLKVNGRQIADPARMEGGRGLRVEHVVAIEDGSPVRICGGVEHVVFGTGEAAIRQHPPRQTCRTVDDPPPGIGY